MERGDSVPDYNWEGAQLYKYAMELFSKAGHVANTLPEYINYSAEQLVYVNSSSETALSREQRSQIKLFNMVSRLFTENQCAFFSLNLLSTKGNRSQTAHDIHTMIHPLIGTRGTVCMFRYDDEIMLSFMGFGLSCILSDWYLMEDDSDLLLKKLDIANVCVNNEYDYFMDMVYILARDYYISEKPSIYEILPSSFINTYTDIVDREALDEDVQNKILAPIRKYGEDYVEYDQSSQVQNVNIGAVLELMLLDLDNEENNPFGEKEKSDDNGLDEDTLWNKDSVDDVRDEYEFDDVDPEIFRDPALMVKWLNQGGK